jgi:uncharacterized tellurite resistance protein B-like protein
MSLLRFLGLGSDSDSSGTDAVDENESVRRISEHLDHMPPESARFLAAFACVLGRIAHADLSIDDDEIEEMKRVIREAASLNKEEAEVVVEIATSQISEFGGTENYLVTREFRKVSTREQRVRLLQCLYAVAAADGTISTTESSEATAIGEELGFTRPEIMGTRAAWKKVLAEFQNR